MDIKAMTNKAKEFARRVVNKDNAIKVAKVNKCTMFDKIFEPALSKPTNSTESAIYSITNQTEDMWSDIRKVEAAQSISKIIGENPRKWEDDILTYAINAMDIISRRVDSDYRKREISNLIMNISRKDQNYDAKDVQ